MQEKQKTWLRIAIFILSCLGISKMKMGKKL